MDEPLCDELPSLVKQQLTESEPRLMSAKGVGGESFCCEDPGPGLEPEVMVLRGSEESPDSGGTPDRLPGHVE